MIKRSELNWKTCKGTLSETPSVDFLLRMGFIWKLQSGVYSLTPIANLFLNSLKEKISKEMNEIGYYEMVSFPISDISFWDKRDGILDEAFVCGDKVIHPTSEETIFYLLQKFSSVPSRVFSYSFNFRNEKRPCFGLCRTTCFLMKDAYSIFNDINALDKEFEIALNSYLSIFSSLGIKEGNNLVLKKSEKECEFLAVSDLSDMKTEILDGKYVVEIAHMFKFDIFGLPSLSFGIGITRLLQFLVYSGNLGYIFPFKYAVCTKHINNLDKAKLFYEKLVSIHGKNAILFDDTDSSFGKKMFDLNSIGFKEKDIFVI